jgi:hypothetical protein
MARINTRKKKIACLESLWDSYVEQPLTVASFVEIVAKKHLMDFIHLTCNTKGELEFCLRTLPNRAGYRILYLGFHGNPGEIELGDRRRVNLEELSELMGTKFKDWVIHFGSCGTLSANKMRLQRFRDATQTSLLIGYKGDVDWVDSAAMDLIILDWLQEFTNLGALWNRIRKDYFDLIQVTGLTVFPKR